MSKGFLNLILLLVYKLKPHKPYARVQETEKKTHQRQQFLRLTSRDAASEFSTLLRFKQGQVSNCSFLKTMPAEIGFPMTLTSGAFVNKKRNKQTSHELQNNLDSSCISFCAPSRKSQFKTSQDDTKLCKLQLSVSKFPDAA